MSDKDRGTYSPPTEDNLNYETRRAPASRDKAPVTLIISGICLVVLLLVVVIFYNYGMNKHGKIAPEVGDSLGDIKEGQIQDAQPLSDQDLSDSGVTAFAPGAEEPGARPAASASTVDIAPLPAAPIEGPLPSQAGSVAANPPAPSVPVPAPAAPASAAPKPVVSSAATNPPVIKPTVKPATPVLTPPKPVTAPAASSAAPVASVKPAAASGGAAVQIGAYDTPEIANKEYAKVASSYGLFVGGAGKRVEKVTTPNGTFYRTAFTGLSPEKAKSFCSALKASGHDCIVK
ncbi:MAG: SPOR domain-containing protein [Asticcacaulis sp.]|uniref:SPOR domain-containing protein n=1 Tax=Asticcacaulis sp. TaxID=1872648 RepID=UPI0039E392A8